MSVTLVFRRFHDDALNCWRNDPESFDESDHPNCASIEMGVEHMAVADLVARALNPQTQAPYKEELYQVIVGTYGESAFADGDYPRIIAARDVARISRLLAKPSGADLRAVFDLGRLKADYLEIEDWLWDDLGPNVLDDRLLPMFEKIRSFFQQAAARKQSVVVSWF